MEIGWRFKSKLKTDFRKIIHEKLKSFFTSFCHYLYRYTTLIPIKYKERHQLCTEASSVNVFKKRLELGSWNDWISDVGL